MNISNKKITIIIVLYEENVQLVLRCLEKIKDFKIIIVDNAYNISLKKIVEKNFKIHRYILNKKNCGYAKAANQAIKISDTEFILMFQADGIIDQKNISKLIDAHTKYENSFIVTPTLFDLYENLCTNTGNFPEKKLEKKPIVIEGDICSETVLGSIILFRRQDILEIGLYDENFFLYFLDDELCRRIRDRKKSVIQISNAKATHAHGQIKVRNPVKKTFLRHFNFTFDELYYFYKIKKHEKLFKQLKSKVLNYSIKLVLSLVILRLNRAAYFLSKIMAFIKFKKLIEKDNI